MNTIRQHIKYPPRVLKTASKPKRDSDRAYRVWSEADDALLLARRNEMTYFAVANILGRTEAAVASRLTEMRRKGVIA